MSATACLELLIKHFLSTGQRALLALTKESARGSGWCWSSAVPVPVPQRLCRAGHLVPKLIGNQVRDLRHQKPERISIHLLNLILVSTRLISRLPVTCFVSDDFTFLVLSEAPSNSSRTMWFWPQELPLVYSIIKAALISNVLWQ